MMKKIILFIILMLFISNRLAHADILLASRNRRLLPAYTDAHKRHLMGLSVPLRWAPEVKAWEDSRAALPLKGQVNPYTSMKERSILGGTETPQIPQETATILYFADKDGLVYHLLPQTYEAIEGDPDIDDPSSFIEDVLLDYKGIRKGETRWAYYKEYGKGSNKRFKVVIVRIADGEIETAHVSEDQPEKPD